MLISTQLNLHFSHRCKFNIKYSIELYMIEVANITHHIINESYTQNINELKYDSLNLYIRLQNARQSNNSNTTTMELEIQIKRNEALFNFFSIFCKTISYMYCEKVLKKMYRCRKY